MSQKHQHGSCVGCLHTYAHGVWDGYSRALVATVPFKEAFAALDARQTRDVNRHVREIGKLLGIEPDEVKELVAHHKAR